LPDTSEVLKWGQPAITEKDGMILAVYAGYKDHMNFVVTPSTKQAFENELSDHKTGAGSIQFLYDQPLPVNLIERMVRYRAEEYRGSGVKWRW